MPWLHLIGENCVYAGRLLVPILLWLSVNAIVKGYIKRSKWSFRLKVYLYLCLAFACLLFLLIARCTHDPTAPHAHNVLLAVK